MSLGETLDLSWWMASRSAGIVAYLLLSASVVVGLVMALRMAPARLTPTLRTAHERIALLALGAVAAHGLVLLGDGWLRPGLSGVLIPFVMDYRPVWTGLGILAGYLAAGLSLTYYARRRLGARRWRTAHRLIPVAWAMAAVHIIGAGTDAGSLWAEVPLTLTISLVVALLVHRVLARRSAGTATVPNGTIPDGLRSEAPPERIPALPAPPTVPQRAPAEPAGGYRPLWVRNVRPGR
jgi:sulfoxide reductase heme-binding subunit YedZ